MKVKIEQSNPKKPVSAVVLTEAILDIGQAMKKLSSTRLSREAIVALIHDKTKVGKSEIKIVLDHLENLEDHWLKKVGK